MTQTPLAGLLKQAIEDLADHLEEFDAIVCAGDFHGLALGAVIAAILDKPYMMVCRDQHIPTQSLIVTIGDCGPKMRYLYVDDWFWGGATLRRVFDYMNQSATSPIVATYECTTRTYKETIDGQYATSAG